MTWKPRTVRVPFRFQYQEKRKQQDYMQSHVYQELALKTMADQQKILNRLVELGPLAMQLDNGARGLADDAGEVSGVIKKHIEYGQPLDITHLKEELGDCFWRMLQICKAAGITFEDCWQANYDKLNKVRYKDGYSDDAAKEENRDRAAERTALENQSMVKSTRPDTIPERTDGGCTPMATLPANWDKDPYTQTGAGWSEPPEEKDYGCQSCGKILAKCPIGTAGICTDCGGSSELKKSVIKVKPLNHSYTRYCRICEVQPIYKTNSVGICTDCFMKHGEPKDGSSK